MEGDYMSNVNTNFAFLDYLNVDQWAEMSDDEQQTFLDQLASLKEKSPEELKDALDQFMEQAGDVDTELRDQKKELKKVLRDYDMDADQKAEAHDIMGELDDLIAALKDMKKDVKNEVNDRGVWSAAHDQKFNPGDEIVVQNLTLGAPDADIELNTYTYDAGNQSTDVLADSQMTDNEFLLDAGVINAKGEVIKDANGDLKFNEDDKIFALRQRDDQKMTIYVNPAADQRIVGLPAYSPGSGEFTFKLEDTQGNFAFLNFKNSGDAIFRFGSGLTQDVAATFPDDFLKRCYIAATTKTYYQAIHGESDDRLKVIKGYSAAVSDLPADSDVRKALDLLFGYLDDPNVEIGDVWTQIEDQIVGDATQKKVILENLIFRVAEKTPEHFSEFFGPVIARLETILEAGDSENLSVQSKTVIMLLETKCDGSAGNYSDIWNRQFIDITGKLPAHAWEGAETVQALQDYRAIASQMGDGIIGRDFTDVLDRVQNPDNYIDADGDLVMKAEDANDNDATIGKVTSGDSNANGTPDVNEPDLAVPGVDASGSTPKEQFQAVLNQFKSDQIPEDDLSSDQLNSLAWDAFIEALGSKLFNDDGSFVDNPVLAIKMTLQNLSYAKKFWLVEAEEAIRIGDQNDNFVALLITLVDQQSGLSDSFKQDFFGALNTFRWDNESVINWIYDGDNPDYADAARDILQKYLIAA